MARDPLELRRHVPTVPDDPNDPPRFAQLVETTKDAFVLGLREYFRTQNFTVARRQELPTVEKYAIDFASGLDPYETYLQIVQEFPDVLERLPHIAITTASGSNRRDTAGPPFTAHTQAPPRVVTSLPGPYALAAAAAQINDITVATLPAGTYTVSINGAGFPITLASGTAADVLNALATALRDGLGLVYEVTVLPSPAIASTLRLRQRSIGEAFTLLVSANLTATLVQAASVADAPDVLVYRTTPDRKNPVVSQVTFDPRRFSTTNPVTAALAEDVARVFNEQALYAEAATTEVGVGTGIRFQTGGPKAPKTPNEIEVLAASTRNAVTALGLADFGDAVLGDAITGVAPNMTLNIAAAPFTGAMTGRYVTISGAPTAANNGRWLIVGVPAAGQLAFTNDDGVAEALAGGEEWFIGYRDDWRNVARPVQNRYQMGAMLSITIDVLAESPNVRREVTDLVWAYFTFFLEQQFFTLYGRGIFDEAYPDENYQVTIHQEVTGAGEGDFQRGADAKNRVHTARVVVPVTTRHYLDRQVLVPSGPAQGQSYTLEAQNVTQDDTLPTPS